MSFLSLLVCYFHLSFPVLIAVPFVSLSVILGVAFWRGVLAWCPGVVARNCLRLAWLFGVVCDRRWPADQRPRIFCPPLNTTIGEMEAGVIVNLYPGEIINCLSKTCHSLVVYSRARFRISLYSIIHSKYHVDFFLRSAARDRISVISSFPNSD